MTEFRVRPRIRRFTEKPAESILNQFQNQLDTGAFEVEGKIVQHHVIVKIPQVNQHFWSPELHLAVEKFGAYEADDENDGKTLVRGNVGPKSTVWTLFIFMYVLVGVLGLFGGIYGLSQLTLKMNPWAFWFMGGAIILLGLIYMAARIGQRMGYEQTVYLIKFLEDTLKEKS